MLAVEAPSSRFWEAIEAPCEKKGEKCAAAPFLRVVSRPDALRIRPPSSVLKQGYEDQDPIPPHGRRIDGDEDLIAQTSGKSKRQVEELLARLFPQPDLPTRVWKLPSPDVTPAAPE
ncbi:MAG TPA: hypothetical protein VGQ78_10990, partial [Vicinamibacteria bacterium]|nr:hypothetical protein [Vicinamibacteria bacterium]